MRKFDDFTYFYVWHILHAVAYFWQRMYFDKSFPMMFELVISASIQPRTSFPTAAEVLQQEQQVRQEALAVAACCLATKNAVPDVPRAAALALRCVRLQGHISLLPLPGASPSQASYAFAGALFVSSSSFPLVRRVVPDGRVDVRQGADV